MTKISVKITVALLTLVTVAAFSFAVNAAFLPKPGNANGDGMVNGRDATHLIKYLAGWNVEADSNFSDVNADGKINGRDATALLKYLAGWDVELHSVREYYNFADYSVDTASDGTADVSAVLQACANEHDNVFVPAGTYLVENVTELHDNSGILGEEGTLFVTNGNNVFSACGVGNDAEAPTRIKNIEIRNFSVQSPIIARAYAISAFSVDGLNVEKINAERIGIVEVSSLYGGLYSMEIKEDESHLKYLSENITVRKCYADGHDSSKTLDQTNMWFDMLGMNLMFMAHFDISDCVIHSYVHGIQFWGGAVTDPYEMTGRFGYGTIENNEIYDIVGGAIWGTMAKELTVKNNYIHTTKDVGIDLEGGADCHIYNNTVKNCNTNFATFEGCLGTITFKGNTSIYEEGCEYDSHYIHAMHADECQTHQQVIFEGNTFISYGKLASVSSMYYAHPAMANFVFRNNKCVNTVLSSIEYPPSYVDYGDISYDCDMQSIIVEGNTFDFELEENSFYPIFLNDHYPAAIRVIANAKTNESASVKVIDNKISAKVSLTGGIYVQIGNASKNYNIVCSDNEVNNCDSGIVIENTQSTATVTAEVKDNITDSIYTIGDGISADFQGNKNHAGESVTA